MSGVQSLLSTLLACLVLTAVGSASGHESAAARPVRTDPGAAVRMSAAKVLRVLPPACDHVAVLSSTGSAQSETEPGCEAEDDENHHGGRPRAHLLDSLDLAAGSSANVWSLSGRALRSVLRALFLLHGRLTC
jgi:hypothetical protein